MSHKQITAVFDVDGTLISGNSLERLFFHFLWRYGEIHWRQLAGLARGPLAALTSGCRALGDNKYGWSGQDIERMRRLARDCFEQEIVRHLAPAAIGRLRWHQQNGHEVILLSGAPDLLLDPLAEFLGVRTWMGTRLEAAGPQLTGRIDGQRLFAQAKLAQFRRFSQQRQSAHVDYARSFAYGDHYEDRFLLAAVGNPVAVNPDRRLTRVARQRGWMIEYFS
ncbi:MAG: HAD family hydrolase [Blastocatellia bacterium]